MSDITKTEEQFLQDEVINALNLKGYEVPILKLAWHIKNQIYDTETAAAVLVSMSKFTPDMAAAVAQKITDYFLKIDAEKKDVELKKSDEQMTTTHTMADDVEKVYGYAALTNTSEYADEPVYKTEQENILSRPKIADTPTYTDPDTNTPPALEPEPATNTEPPDTRWNTTA